MNDILDISEFINLEPVIKPGPNGSVRIYHDRPLVDTLGALLAASYRDVEGRHHGQSNLCLVQKIDEGRRYRRRRR